MTIRNSRSFWTILGVFANFIAACSANVEAGATQGTGGAASCLYNGKGYAVGESFDVSCNTCACTNGGMICTQRDCVMPTGGSGAGGASIVVGCASSGQSYAPGAAMPSPDSCNTCYCSSAGVTVCSHQTCAVGGQVSLGGASGTGGTIAKGGSSVTGGAKYIPAGGNTAIGTTPTSPAACPGIPYITGSSSLDAGACVVPGLKPPVLNMYLMVDRTQSMTYLLTGTTMARWDAVQGGISDFVSNTGFGVRVALQFFGATGNPNDPRECDPVSYESPLIDFEALSTAGPKIVNAVQSEAAYLGGQTPWFPAIQGALMHAQTWQASNPTEASVAVLLTDGYPTECNTDVAQIQQMVSEYYSGITGTYNTKGAPGIRTYIVGIAVDKFNLDAVAQAGGTNQAIIADGVSASSQISTALEGIASSFQLLPGCQLTLPTTTGISTLRLVYTPTGGNAQEIPLVGSAAACSSANGGFYFDNPASTTSITLCPCTCANVGMGQLQFVTGCGS